MTNRLDFAAVNSAALSSLESLCMEWFPAGKKDGHEFRIGSINGEPGSSMSINLTNGRWADFAGDLKGSDPISLLAAIRGCKQGEAAKELAERLSLGNLTATAPKAEYEAKASAASEWEPLPHAPEGCHEPDLNHYKHGKPVATWAYHTAEGHRVGLICRFNLEDGSKEVLPITWCQHVSGKQAWRWKSFAKPRPLYNLPAVVASDASKWVLIVEGEKTADAAARLLPSLCVTTWSGGSKAVSLADWSPLAERRVLFWPDADEPGRKCIELIRKQLPNVRIVTPPADVAEGWDLADAEAEGWTTDQVRAHIRGEPRAEAKPVDEPPHVPTPPEVLEAMEYAALPSEPDPVTEEPWPFRVLGHDDGTYYYLPNSSQQIVAMGANDHKHLPFLRLAGANWWESHFPAKDGADWKAAANALIQACHREGIYSPRRVRGRGCWIDGDNVLFHAGDRLIVNSSEVKILEHKSKWIYAQAERIDTDDCPALSNAEAAKLLALTDMMNWNKPIFSKFFAGWCAIAPICGVLSWRPHIWVNGPSGSGKTWLLNNILDPLVGRLALQVQSATTEAGIRQALKSDALPVIFDEAESEDKRGQARMQSILELARQASAETGAGIIKGSASGKAMEFQIRSCFAFASIGVAAIQRADTSRITNLELRKDNTEAGQARFDALKALWGQTVARSDYSAGLRARSLQNALSITANAKTFGKAVAVKLGDQRTGDQLGALLAGAFSLTSTRIMSMEDATAWVDKQDWHGFLSAEADKDEVRAMSWLMDKTVRFEAEDGRSYMRSIGELIEGYYSEDTRSDDAKTIKDNLLRFGVKVEDDTVAISNHHPALRTLFMDTSWADKWKDQISRVPGAAHVAGIRFGASIHRAVRLPKSAFLG